MGSDLTPTEFLRWTLVSIHAPTWGATGQTKEEVQAMNVSIHAPTWGATRIEQVQTIIDKFQSTLPHGERPQASRPPVSRSGFNPRSHKGSDNMTVQLQPIRRVSIHAPTWGATQIMGYASVLDQFQSTLPHGERLVVSLRLVLNLVFQSTLPHGERHIDYCIT